MSFSLVIKYCVAAGVILGGCDYLLGSRFGIGKKFQEGFRLAGPTMMSMIGIMSIAPAIAALLGPVVTPVCRVLGMDPAILGMLLCCDMGGYPLAVSLADSPAVAQMVGLTAAAMLGGTLVFSIPVGMGIIKKEQHPIFFQGILFGLMTVPVGTAVTGFMVGLDAGAVFLNLISVAVLSAAIILGFLRIPTRMAGIANCFGRAVTTIGIASIVAGFVSQLTGVNLIPHYTPIMESMTVVSGVVIFLVGALPAMELFILLLQKPVKALGSRFGLLMPDTVGLLVTTASGIPMFTMVHTMSRRGVLMNSAWVVTSAGFFGSQVSFVLGVVPEALAAFVVGKLASGLLALAITIWYTQADSWSVQPKAFQEIA